MCIRKQHAMCIRQPHAICVILNMHSVSVQKTHQLILETKIIAVFSVIQKSQNLELTLNEGRITHKATS